MVLNYSTEGRPGIIVRRYEEQDREAWEKLVAASWNGTFLHQRKFLAYHGNRFQDLSLLVANNKGHTVGVLPAALDPAGTDGVLSHPGLTYGGLVHNGALRGAAMLEALQAIAKLYRAMGLKVLRYGIPPVARTHFPYATLLSRILPSSKTAGLL